ncbi:MAG TPA: sugar phosphate isomerase/epimerase family protein [Gemmataceae bacterium]|nr:sugar phosphate isomerase/epimerase family protein [Gemmataceae bacterium]
MLEIGVMLNNLEPDRLAAFAVAAQHGFRVVHTSAVPEAWIGGPVERRAYIKAARGSRLRIASMFVGYDGQSYHDIASIARTVGLAVTDLRPHRFGVTLAYIDLLAWPVRARSLSTHLGFFPSDPRDPEHRAMVEVVREVADHCSLYGLGFHLETGQESANELLRFIHEVDKHNVGVNFDAANFLLYGTDDPLAALDRLGPHIRGVHCKDGFPPTEPGLLGKEVPLGQGQVDWPAILRRLHALNYRGPLIIERERGPSVVADILAARTYLEQLQEKL